MYQPILSGRNRAGEQQARWAAWPGHQDDKHRDDGGRSRILRSC